MEDEWLSKLDHNHAVIVPTRNLANELNERVARYFLSLGTSVWVAPTILVWPDYLRQLWLLNRNLLAVESGAHSLISSQQAAVLWAQVIDVSRRAENELTLLNVQQTTRAVQRSWKLMHDWRVNASQLQRDHVADTEQFVLWTRNYQKSLEKRGLLDEQLLMAKLIDAANVQHPYERLHFISYDLLTASQRAYLEKAEQAGLQWSESKPNVELKLQCYLRYDDSKSEVVAALNAAKKCLENDPEHKVSIVIPDLAHRQAEIQELARHVFYPCESPLSVQNKDAVYSFSLGEPLQDIPAIEAAMSIIALLKNNTNTTEFGFLLRNQFLGLCVQHREATRLFEQWLKQQRVHSFSFDQTPILYKACIDYFIKRDQKIEIEFLEVLEKLVESRRAIQERLASQKEASEFAALKFADWAKIYSDWLALWQWQTASDGSQLSSVQYQLKIRWQALLEEFANLSAVQQRAGLSRAMELLQQMTRNTVFSPKGANSPILISGVFEAIGRQVDTCMVTAMHQDYPAPPSGDAFISNRFLAEAGHPEAKPESGVLHAKNLITNLLNCAKYRRISYACVSDQNREASMLPSSLFKNVEWHDASLDDVVTKASVDHVVLEHYQDTQGPPWLEPGRAKGGSKIFENQSHCAFKAFVHHQLGFLGEDEAEFGLDGLDRGNVVHQLLDMLWERLQSKAALDALDENARSDLVNNVIDECFAKGRFQLSQEKLRLLKHEKQRLESLLLDWLDEESKRPMNFSVIEREEQREGELGGIRYRYIVDRLDMTDDGRTVIVDYKTGAVNRNDWSGERIKSPQMPLYALALDELKNKPVSGIAFAQVKKGESKYIELAEGDIFRKASRYSDKYEQDWLNSRDAWPAVFEQLAKDFLAGEASVNPIDELTCQYCELHSLCRVSQLRDTQIDEGRAS